MRCNNFLRLAFYPPHEAAGLNTFKSAWQLDTIILGNELIVCSGEINTLQQLVK
jgi:hypothetical protein